MPRQYFFHRGQLLGTVERKLLLVHWDLHQVRGTAFFCPKCSELWANCPVEGKESSVVMRPCEKHTPSHKFEEPGCFSLTWDKDFTEALPPAVLRHEILLHFNYLAKEGLL